MKCSVGADVDNSFFLRPWVWSLSHYKGSEEWGTSIDSIGHIPVVVFPEDELDMLGFIYTLSADLHHVCEHVFILHIYLSTCYIYTRPCSRPWGSSGE